MTWLTRHYGELLAQRAFMRFWIARLKGVMANQMLMVAVGWHMYDLTGSPWDLGLVGLFQFVPALVMTLPAGHIADRHHRARIFAATTATQGLVAAALMWGTLTGQVSREMILGLSVLLGLARAFQMPAQQALPPLLVPRELLPRAIALGSSGMEIAIISGPALGGVLYTHGATLVYGTCVALLTLSTMLALAVHYTRSVHRASMTWASLFSGLRFVRQQKVVLGATTLDLFAVLLGGVVALLPVYAHEVLKVGPEGLGLLRSSMTVGEVAMGLWLSARPIQRRVGRVMFGAVAVFGVANLVFALSHWFWLSMAALMLAGAADMVSVYIRSALVQFSTPDAMRGRVNAVNMLFIGSSNELGEFRAGTSASLLGAVPAAVLGSLCTLGVVGGWMGLFKPLRDVDRLEDAARVGQG